MTTSTKPRSPRKVVAKPTTGAKVNHKILNLFGNQAEVESTLNGLTQYGWTVHITHIEVKDTLGLTTLFNVYGIATKTVEA
jgi:hypothetical protein